MNKQLLLKVNEEGGIINNIQFFYFPIVGCPIQSFEVMAFVLFDHCQAF